MGSLRSRSQLLSYDVGGFDSNGINSKFTMTIEIKPRQFDKPIVTMGRLKSGCTCWHSSWYKG